MLILSINAYSETIETYKASNGITYKIGDEIKLNKGSGPSGGFLYLQMGGWGAAMSYNTNGGPDQMNIGRQYNGINVTLKKIKEQKIKGQTKIYFVVGGGNITNYNLMIEDAIATCEIVDCVAKTTKTENINELSKADEIKKLKDLMDSGAITKDEFEAEKKKILAK